jgi:hypothetical protein
VGSLGRVRARPSLWSQLAVVAALLWVYDAINNLNPLRRATALAHGASVLHAEVRLHLDAELALNRWLAGHASLGRFLGDYYDTAHFVVTLGLLGLVWWRYGDRYRPLRNALVGVNVIGFATFWLYPVAPPRMLPGFVDVVAVTHSVGGWGSGALASAANEYAAMPSLHIGWAVWCAVAVWVVRRDVLSRALACVYIVATAVVVMATANHYFLDVVAGAAAGGVSVLAAWWWQQRRAAPGPPVPDRAPTPLVRVPA